MIFFFWVKNHKDSNLSIYRMVTPHLASIIREWGVPHKWVFQIIELYSPKSQGLKEINHFDSFLKYVPLLSEVVPRYRFSSFSATLIVRTLHIRFWVGLRYSCLQGWGSQWRATVRILWRVQKVLMPGHKLRPFDSESLGGGARQECLLKLSRWF